MIYVLEIQISVFGAAFQTFRWGRFHATGALLAGTTLETSSTELPRCRRMNVPPFDVTDGFGAACVWLSLFHSVDDTTYVLLQKQHSKRRLITHCCRNHNKTFALSSVWNGSNISLPFKTWIYSVLISEEPHLKTHKILSFKMKPCLHFENQVAMNCLTNCLHWLNSTSCSLVFQDCLEIIKMRLI